MPLFALPVTAEHVEGVVMTSREHAADAVI
jgi:hypothetical protein